MLKIVIPGNPVTKKNHGRIVQKKMNNGTYIPIVLPSEPYVKYEKHCKEYMPQIQEAINYPVNLKCTFYMQTRRKVDVSNLISAISDILTKYKIIQDDNRNIVASYDGSRVYYDKENPKVIVEISEIEDYEQW